MPRRLKANQSADASGMSQQDKDDAATRGHSETQGAAAGDTSRQQGDAFAPDDAHSSTQQPSTKPNLAPRLPPLPGVPRVHVLILYIVLILAGVPVWWRTTEVYRATIPFHLLEQVSSQLQPLLSHAP